MRRTYAALLCFVWLLGIEVLPNVHLLSHASGAPHQHATDGTVITVSFESTTHSHDGVTHSHAKPQSPKAKRKAHRDVLAIDRVPDLHAAAGLAHRAAALHEPPPVILDAIAIERIATDIIDLATGRDSVSFVATADARGPPIS